MPTRRSIVLACLAALLSARSTPMARGQCAQPAANGQLYSLSAPDLDGASSTTLGAQAGAFSAADNVTLASGGSISSLCFWGRYNTAGNPNPIVPPANVEQFRITFFTDAGGFPSTTVFAGPFTINQANGSLLSRTPIPYPVAPATGFGWTASLSPAVTVSAGQCLWMQIQGDTPGHVVANRWRWDVLNNAAGSPFADGHACQVANPGPYTFASRVLADYAWAINLPIAAAGCFPAAANSLCSSAQSQAVPSTLTNVDGTRGRLVPTIPCKTLPVNGPGLWYSVVGNGTTYTASSCGNTNYDTAIAVFCGACSGTDNSGLNCIASNDSAPASCAGPGDTSLVSWPTTTGVTYYVCVYGFEQAAGSVLDVQFASDSTQASTHPPCASDFCPVNLSGIPPANFEADACGSETNGADCTGAANAGIHTIVPGQTYAGTVQTDGPIRDRDFWEFSGFQPSTFYTLTASTELPSVIFEFNGACPGDGANFGTATIAAPFTYCDAFSQDFQTDSTRVGRIMVATNHFYGLPCSLNRNHYRFTVTASPTGACCTATACVAGSINNCTAAGTTFVPGGTCTPNSCAPAGVCCRGATCTTTITSAANCTTGGGGALAGAFFATGTGTCNSGPISNSPCCFANYNKVGGVTVQDIFDFLNDWFAARPYALTGGNGTSGTLSVQNIFDFLSDWFNGGCN